MVTLQSVLDQYPNAQECVNQAIGFFEHAGIPLHDLEWNPKTQQSVLEMKALPNVAIFKNFVHGGYSASIIDAVGALTGLLSVAPDDCQCVTTEIRTHYYKKVEISLGITVKTAITKQSVTGSILKAEVNLIQNGAICVQGIMTLQKVKII